MKLTKKTGEPGAIELLRREMDQFFDDMVPFSWSRENGGRALDTWAPSTDITEDEKEYMIRMDIPGMEKNDIRINVQDGRITVTGDRKTEEKEEKKDFVRQERYHGSFYRSFTLPEKLNEDTIQASFKNGVLKLVVPKAEVVKPKTIKVN
jgi:HSP20 family protein